MCLPLWSQVEPSTHAAQLEWDRSSLYPQDSTPGEEWEWRRWGGQDTWLEHRGEGKETNSYLQDLSPQLLFIWHSQKGECGSTTAPPLDPP